MAYSLLGLLRVNMPLLYGEGRRAFTRLQETVLRDRGDHSLFAFVANPAKDEAFNTVLADGPRVFEQSGHVKLLRAELATGGPITINSSVVRFDGWSVELDCVQEVWPSIPSGSNSLHEYWLVETNCKLYDRAFAVVLYRPYKEARFKFIDAGEFESFDVRVIDAHAVSPFYDPRQSRPLVSDQSRYQVPGASQWERWTSLVSGRVGAVAKRSLLRDLCLNPIR